MGTPNTNPEALVLLKELIRKETYESIRNPYNFKAAEFAPTAENKGLFKELNDEIYLARLWGKEKYILTGAAWECFPEEKKKRDKGMEMARNLKYVEMLKRVV